MPIDPIEKFQLKMRTEVRRDGPAANESVNIIEGHLALARLKIKTSEVIFDFRANPFFHSYWLIVPKYQESPDKYAARVAAFVPEIINIHTPRIGIAGQIAGPFICHGNTFQLSFPDQALPNLPEAFCFPTEVMCLDLDWLYLSQATLITQQSKVVSAKLAAKNPKDKAVGGKAFDSPFGKRQWITKINPLALKIRGEYRGRKYG